MEMIFQYLYSRSEPVAKILIILVHTLSQTYSVCAHTYSHLTAGRADVVPSDWIQPGQTVPLNLPET